MARSKILGSCRSGWSARECRNMNGSRLYREVKVRSSTSRKDMTQPPVIHWGGVRGRNTSALGTPPSKQSEPSDSMWLELKLYHSPRLARLVRPFPPLRIAL